MAYLLLANPIAAQDALPQIVIGETPEIESQILGETRQVIIGKPASYDASMKSYPVLYLLDGEEQFFHTAGLTLFLADNIRIPEFIVVGVVNTDRTRDLTPPTPIEESIDGDSELGALMIFAASLLRSLRLGSKETIGRPHAGSWSVTL